MWGGFAGAISRALWLGHRGQAGAACDNQDQP